jgi:hypothetical protein
MFLGTPRKMSMKICGHLFHPCPLLTPEATLMVRSFSEEAGGPDFDLFKHPGTVIDKKHKYKWSKSRP